MTLRRRLHLGEGDRGVGVVELLVAMVLTAVLGTIVVTSLTGGLRSTSKVADQSNTGQQMQLALTEVARSVRHAAPMEVAGTGPQTLTVRTFGNGSCQRVTYRVVNGTLERETTSLTPAPPALGQASSSTATCTTAGTPTRKVLLRRVSPTAVTFAYWSDREAGGPRQLSFVPPSTDTPAQANSVVITLTRPAAGRERALTVTTRVNLRNHSLTTGS